MPSGRFFYLASHFWHLLPLLVSLSVWVAYILYFWLKCSCEHWYNFERLPRNQTIFEHLTRWLNHRGYAHKLPNRTVSWRVFQNCINVRTMVHVTTSSYGKSRYSSDKMKLVKTGLWIEDKNGSRDLKKGFKIFRGINCYFIYPAIPYPQRLPRTAFPTSHCLNRFNKVVARTRYITEIFQFQGTLSELYQGAR